MFLEILSSVPWTIITGLSGYHWMTHSFWSRLSKLLKKKKNKIYRKPKTPKSSFIFMLHHLDTKILWTLDRLNLTHLSQPLILSIWSSESPVLKFSLSITSLLIFHSSSCLIDNNPSFLELFDSSSPSWLIVVVVVVVVVVVSFSLDLPCS